ncbi:MAG TPA: BamA/TamA family outer membrane protein [Steroidobacteraceae bacterium]|nr:BamA/TamA family outer membrane protein [Steroidobacteraceae bacterium]
MAAERAGAARRALALLVVLAAVLASVPEARAADPQPYRIDWVSSGNHGIDSAMKATSQLQSLRTSAKVGPFELIARARGDINRLQTVLKSFGYYQGAVTITIDGLGLDDARLADELTARPKGSDARVKISARLGARFHIGRIEIQGSLPAGMQGRLGLTSGAPAVAAQVLAAGGALQNALQNAGYAFATVAAPVAYEVPAQHLLNLTYKVSSGPRVRIGKIRIDGLQHVHESLIDARLLVHTGELYDAADVQKARLDLLSLGLFTTVSVQLGAAPDAQGRVPITFRVREAKRFTIGVSAAYSTDLGGSAGFNWGNADVFGHGEQLTFNANAIDLGGSASTGIGYDVTLGYSLPDFHHRDQTLHFSVEGVRQELQAYAENGQIVGTSLSRRLSSVWNATAGLSYEYEVVGQPGATCLTSQLITKAGVTVCPYSQINNYSLVLLPLSALYDSTDLASPLADPTHGFRISLNVTPTFSYSHTGAVFVVSQATAATYLDLHKLFAAAPAGRTVIAARVMLGMASGASWSDLPPDERFYAGGSGTVRGFRYQSVGPQFTTNGSANGVPQGGTTLRVLNLELRQRIGAHFGMVTFMDEGGVSQSARLLSGAFRMGVGAGVRYYSPIGPVRLDIALPAHRQANDDRFEVYIGLGQAF